jgi:endoribonuclease Dicer
MRYITDYDRLRIGTSGLDVGEVELSRLHEALSPPAANYGHDYQRLETLGDRVLQLATTVYLYQEYPHKHEGLLSPLRANSVCNRFLRNKAHAAGLGSIMCMEPVMIARWDPPYWKEIDEENGMVLRTVKRKWMQDCLEGE